MEARPKAGISGPQSVFMELYELHGYFVDRQKKRPGS